MVRQRADVLPRAVVEEIELVVEGVGAPDGVGEGAGKLLRCGGNVGAGRQRVVLDDLDQAFELRDRDPAGAQERGLHLARGRDRHVAGGGRLLGDALDLPDRGACSPAGAGERDLELLLRLDVAVVGVADRSAERGNPADDRDRRRDQAGDALPDAAQDAGDAGARTEDLGDLRPLLHQHHQGLLAARERDDHVVELEAEVRELVRGQLAGVADRTERFRRGVVPGLRQCVRGRLLGGGDRTCLEQRIGFGDLGVESLLRRAERIDLRAQGRGAGRKVFRRSCRLLEDSRRLARGLGRPGPDAEDGIEAALRLVGRGCLPRGLREALQSLPLPVGRGASRIHRAGDTAERVLSCLADLVERALDLRLALDAEADRDLGGAHLRVSGVGADDDRLDLGKSFHEQRVQRAHGIGEHQYGPEIERVDAPHDGAHLSGRALEHRPGRDPVRGIRRVLGVRTGRARGRAGGAIAVAPAEVPLGEGDQPFFSASCRRAGPT